MADDLHEASPKNELSRVESNEDAETRAARRELKQSTISDPPVSTGDSAATSTDGKTTRPDTPADNVTDERDDELLRAHVSSPKKKRGHDQLDGGKDAEDNDVQSVASTDSTKDRSLRLEPEKKRARDEESQGEASNTPVEPMAETEKEKTSAKKAPETSTSAFAASGFAKMAAESSPFKGFGSSQSSIFASASSSSVSPFASISSAATTSKPAATTAAPKLTFGSADGASPFAGLSTANGFGSAIGGSSFGSAFASSKGTQAFGLPAGKPLQSKKPAKPFGAPDSDGEDEVEDEEGDDDAEPTEADRSFSPEKEIEDKKKLKLQKVEVDDGESGEVTVVSVRAKMFHHDKEAGWKERGTGMLKINAPVSCVEFDDADLPIPGSFDASGFDTDESELTTRRKVVRLIMRQDQTHRIILNTAVLPAMAFQEKASLKSVGILFTAFEGEDAKPVSVTMKMSAANAKIFLAEINAIQKGLRSN